MNKIFYFFFLLTASNLSLSAQQTDCVRTPSFGEKDICLPQIKGYVESYLEPDIKILADATEVAANQVLGFYLNQETHQNKEEGGLDEFDDYFKVYATTQLEDLDTDEAMLRQMQATLDGNFITKNWDEMEKEIDKIGLEVQVGVPTVIKSYSLDDNSFTYVMLIKYQFEGMDPYTMAMTMNGMLVNQRLIWMAYYLNYEGEETIPLLEKNSNRILDTFTSLKN